MTEEPRVDFAPDEINQFFSHPIWRSIAQEAAYHVTDATAQFLECVTDTQFRVVQQNMAVAQRILAMPQLVKDNAESARAVKAEQEESPHE